MLMRTVSLPLSASDGLVSYYWSGEALRSRSVGALVWSGTVAVPAPPMRLVADWNRDVHARLGLEPGDVEQLSLARARRRWPDYGRCVQALTDELPPSLQAVRATSDVALMVCRGARYHHDAAQYGDMAFCNVFLTEDRGLDLHFPVTGHRIPLTRGTAVLFDTAQPHAVIARAHTGFHAADFSSGQDCSVVFLTWEFPIEQAAVAQALDIRFDVDPVRAGQLGEAQVQRAGAPLQVCPDSGRWGS